MDEAVTSKEGKELLDTDTCSKKVTNPFGPRASHLAPNPYPFTHSEIATVWLLVRLSSLRPHPSPHLSLVKRVYDHCVTDCKPGRTEGPARGRGCLGTSAFRQRPRKRNGRYARGAQHTT